MALKKKHKLLPVVGWQEWVALPDFGLPAVKAKIDTGARTSSLHAYNILFFERKGKRYVRFDVYPLQRSERVIRTCEAPLKEHRHVRSSSGDRQHRPVIVTLLTLGGETWEIELNLTNRDSMGFRMLLGRQTLKRRRVVDPGRRFREGKMTPEQALNLYQA